MSRELTGPGWRALACPACRAPLDPLPGQNVLGCGYGHRFDVARQGYVALLARGARLDTGDSAEMVHARQVFLDGGHYAPVAGSLARMVAGQRVSGPVLEIGAGPGHYLRAVLDATGAAGIALDASKYAARRAAADPRTAAVVADAWSDWPIRSGSIGAVLTVFAPRNRNETGRVLADRGLVAVVVPEPDHQAELRGPLGLLGVDAGKADSLESLYGPPVAHEHLRYQARWDRDAVSAAVGMGPTARHLTRDELTTRVAALPATTTVTVSVRIALWRPGRDRVSEPDGTGVRYPG